MNILKHLEVDSVCKKAFAAMGVCVIVLILCGALRDSLAAIVIGDIAACVVISLYACTVAYMLCNALAEEAGSYGEFVLRSGHILCAACAAAQVVKLFFLLTPRPGAELVGGCVLLADAAVSWIPPMMMLKGQNAIFSEHSKDKPSAQNDLILEKKISERY